MAVNHWHFFAFCGQRQTPNAAAMFVGVAHPQLAFFQFTHPTGNLAFVAAHGLHELLLRCAIGQAQAQAQRLQVQRSQALFGVACMRFLSTCRVLPNKVIKDTKQALSGAAVLFFVLGLRDRVAMGCMDRMHKGAASKAAALTIGPMRRPRQTRRRHL